MAVCARCKGKGKEPCLFCSGSGKLPDYSRGATAKLDCTACNKGYTGAYCTSCRGSGKAK